MDIKSISHQFSNGVVIINTTPHSIRFQDIDGSLIEIPSSVPEGERVGWALINAQAEEKVIADDLIRTIFVGSEEGRALIATLLKEARTIWPGAKIRLVGSVIAANAYREVVGMIPASGYERVPPAEKRMRVDRFNTGNCI